MRIDNIFWLRKNLFTVSHLLFSRFTARTLLSVYYFFSDTPAENKKILKLYSAKNSLSFALHFSLVIVSKKNTRKIGFSKKHNEFSTENIFQTLTDDDDDGV